MLKTAPVLIAPFDTNQFSGRQWPCPGARALLLAQTGFQEPADLVDDVIAAIDVDGIARHQPGAIECLGE